MFDNEYYFDKHLSDGILYKLFTFRKQFPLRCTGTQKCIVATEISAIIYTICTWRSSVHIRVWWVFSRNMSKSWESFTRRQKRGCNIENITFLELFPVGLTLYIWDDSLQNKKIIFNVHNHSVVAIFQIGKSNVPCQKPCFVYIEIQHSDKSHTYSRQIEFHCWLFISLWLAAFQKIESKGGRGLHPIEIPEALNARWMVYPRTNSHTGEILTQVW